MKITVLDGHTLNPGDLDWDGLRALGEVRVHDRTRGDDLAARTEGSEVILTNKVPLPAAFIRGHPTLRYIGVLATGHDIVASDAAASRGIPVTNIPDYGAASVAQHVFALLLELTQAVGRHSLSVKAGAWSASPDFCFTEQPLVELAGRKLGILGYGSIGRRVARIGASLGMEILASSRRPRPPEDGIAWRDPESLLRESDVLTLHCPLTEDTRHLINARTLSLMKPDAYLINTARGRLIDEPALAAALHAGRLAGAGLDVLACEPPPPDCPLLSAPRCIITPHHAWATQAARARLMAQACQNLARWIAGPPVNVVNGVTRPAP